MSSMSQDPDTQKMYELIMKYFDLNDLRELYFSLGIDWEGVPQPAIKSQYVWHLLRFVGSNQDQDLLLSKLVKLRPRLFWPKTFSIPVAVQSATSPGSINTGSINIGTFIGRQDVNINLPRTATPRKATNNKRSRASRPSKTSQVELELFNNFFASTRLYVFITVIIFLLLPVSASLWILLNEQIWQGDGLLLSFIFLGLIFFMVVIPYKLMFTSIYSKVSRQTSFYQLDVSSRHRAKGMLQNRNWGNGFWNFTCRFFIGVFLQPNKNKANKLKF